MKPDGTFVKSPTALSNSYEPQISVCTTVSGNIALLHRGTDARGTLDILDINGTVVKTTTTIFSSEPSKLEILRTLSGTLLVLETVASGGVVNACLFSADGVKLTNAKQIANLTGAEYYMPPVNLSDGTIIFGALLTSANTYFSILNFTKDLEFYSLDVFNSNSINGKMINQKLTKKGFYELLYDGEVFFVLEEK